MSGKLIARRHAWPDSWHLVGTVVACRAGVARLKHVGVKADCHLDLAVPLPFGPAAVAPDAQEAIPQAPLPVPNITSAQRWMASTPITVTLGFRISATASQPKIGFISTWITVTNMRVTLEECWISKLYN